MQKAGHAGDGDPQQGGKRDRRVTVGEAPLQPAHHPRRQRGTQARQSRLRRSQVDQDAVIVADLEPAVEGARIEALNLLPPDEAHRVTPHTVVHTGGANIPPQSITGVSKPLTVRPGWFIMMFSVLVGLIGTALIGFAAFLMTVAIQRGTLAEIGAVSAAVAVIGLLLLGVAAGNARSRTIVSSAGLELHPFIGRVKTLSWQQSHDRIWLHTAHIYGSWAITVCKISVALDEKQVVLPGAVTQGLFRKRTQARAERIVEQIRAMDPLNH